MRVLVAIFVCIWLAGCVTNPNAPNDLREQLASDDRTVLAASKIVPDPNTGWTEVLGPAVSVGRLEGPRTYLVRSWTDPKRTDVDNSFQLQAAFGFPKRVYLKQAYANGHELPTKVIDRERVDCGYGCAVVETVGIRLSEADMVRLSETGLTFEVLGRRADVTLSVRPAISRRCLRPIAAFDRAWADDAGQLPADGCQIGR